VTYNGYLKEYVPVIMEMAEKGADIKEIAEHLYSQGVRCWSRGYKRIEGVQERVRYIVKRVAGHTLGRKPLDAGMAERWHGILPVNLIADQVAWDRRHGALRAYEADCAMDIIVQKLGLTTRARAYQLMNKARADREYGRRSPAERYLSYRQLWEVDGPTLMKELARGLDISVRLLAFKQRVDDKDRGLCQCPKCGRMHWVLEGTRYLPKENNHAVESKARPYDY
jgi:hypothetical protein